MAIKIAALGQRKK